jgi:gamma-glutamylcyclotransferase (GGCT)/AIG2-like uncharacterized protein YtfP
MLPTMTREPYLLFVYGSLLEGERDHDLLVSAEHVGPATTPPRYHLVELTQFPALVPGGRLEVIGELYRVSRETLLAIDVRKEVPRLFARERIELADGQVAEAYTMRPDQAPGRRRLRNGDWRQRFGAHRRPEPGPFVRWAKRRR